MYSLPGVVKEYKSRRMCWAGHVAYIGEKKTRIFYCLSTSAYKTAFAFPESRTKTPKEISQPEPEDRMPEQVTKQPGNRTRRIAGAHRSLDCWARPRSANPTCLPPVQREQILRTLLWKMRADAMTP